MKKIQLLNWILLAFVAFQFTSCEDEPLVGQFPQPTDPNVALEGQFKAQVDGEEFLSSANITTLNLDNDFQVSATTNTGELIILTAEAIDVGTFVITQVPESTNRALYAPSTASSNPYLSNAELGGSGTLDITDINFDDQLISGTFSFAGKRPALDADGNPILNGNGDPLIETVSVTSGIFNAIPFTIDPTGGGGGGSGGGGGPGGDPLDMFFANVDGDEFVEDTITTSLYTVGSVDMINVVAQQNSGALMRIDIPFEQGEGTFPMESISDGSKLIALYNSNTGGENLISNPGTITITEFDTVLGVLEATFSFTGSDPLGQDPTIVQVTEGSFTVYFEGVPGSGPAPFGADIDGIALDPTDVTTTVFDFGGTPTAIISAENGTQSILITMPTEITVGTHNFTTVQIPGEPHAAYNVGGTNFTSTAGTITIVSNDTTTGEIVGTFVFTAEDSTGGDPTIYEITNGEFDLTIM